MSVLSEEAPYLRDEAITAALREAWGIEVTSIRRLESERDFNVMVNDAFVLKVSNPARLWSTGSGCDGPCGAG